MVAFRARTGVKGCRVCGSPIEPFLSFGHMPVANGFLTHGEFAAEPFFPLAVGFCAHCAMTQLMNAVPPHILFGDEYPFYTGTSAGMTAHFRRLAQTLKRERLTGGDSFIVEVGSNDGTLLEHLSAAGIRHLGIEPSANVAAAARARGVRTLCAFFDENVAADVVREHGQADVIVAANCFCHIPDLASLGASLVTLLKPGGVVVFEDPYVGDIVAQTAYDQIYDEHVFYFSVTSVGHWAERHGLEVVDADRQAVHGGSMRYTLGRRGEHAAAARVTAKRLEEQRLGLYEQRTYEAFRDRVEHSRMQLVKTLDTLKRSGSRVVGYGATSKSTTLINYCGITSATLEYISDTTPEKQGRFSPGAHIPVIPVERFRERYPDYALLFAWNHADEILKKEEGFRKAGGRWIVYVPDVAILA